MKAQEQALKRILIVDDDADVRRLLIRVLRDGYQVRQAECGRRALEMAAAGRFDLLLLDVAMPGMNGLDVLQSLKAAYPDLPVVMLTGAMDMDVAARALNMGAKAYVTKPLVIRELLDVLGGLLNPSESDESRDARPWRVAGD